MAFSGSRYSGLGVAPQLLSPPRPICMAETRTTVWWTAGSSWGWAAYSSWWGVQGRAENSIPSPWNSRPRPLSSVTEAQRTPVWLPHSWGVRLGPRLSSAVLSQTPSLPPRRRSQ